MKYKIGMSWCYRLMYADPFDSQQQAKEWLKEIAALGPSQKQAAEHAVIMEMLEDNQHAKTQ